MLRDDRQLNYDPVPLTKLETKGLKWGRINTPTPDGATRRQANSTLTQLPEIRSRPGRLLAPTATHLARGATLLPLSFCTRIRCALGLRRRPRQSLVNRFSTLTHASLSGIAASSLTPRLRSCFPCTMPRPKHVARHPRGDLLRGPFYMLTKPPALPPFRGYQLLLVCGAALGYALTQLPASTRLRDHFPATRQRQQRGQDPTREGHVHVRERSFAHTPAGL